MEFSSHKINEIDAKNLQDVFLLFLVIRLV